MAKIYKTKLVEKVDDDIWTRFTGYCKMNKILAGPTLSEILEEFLSGTAK